MEKLSPKQAKAVVVLLQGGKLEAAARRANVSYSTLRRWLTQESFRDAVNEARTQALDSAYTAISGAALKAAKTLEGIVADKEAPAGAKVQAARVIMEMSLKMREKMDMELRMAKLESLMRDKTGEAWQPKIA